MDVIGKYIIIYKCLVIQIIIQMVKSFFYEKIKNNINTIFDIGCREDSVFIDFKGEVHYFDPLDNFIYSLKQQKNFNNFGLGSSNKEIYYYPRYQSFYNRINSCKVDDDADKNG